jgi:hypothetical protein
MVERFDWCIMNMNVIAFYISICIYFYMKWINGNTEMSNYAFQVSVLIGFLALLKKK